MAGGNGPAPKPQEERRRRNKPAAGEWRTLPSDPYTGPKPTMPSGLHSTAKRTWKTWWSSPIAHELGANESAWPGLERLILLISGFYKALTDPSAQGRALEYLKEIRLQEERFGLSPKGLQSLRLRVVGEPAEAESAPGPSGRYEGLRLIKGG